MSIEMDDLKASGSTLSLSTGYNLPIPYIDRIIVDDGKLHVQVSFYLEFHNADMDTTKITERFETKEGRALCLFYIGQIFDGQPDSYYDYPEMQVTYGTTRMQDLVENNKGIMRLLVDQIDGDNVALPYTDWFADSDGATYSITDHLPFKRLLFGDFTISETTWDRDGKTIAKYTSEMVELNTPMLNLTSNDIFAQSMDLNLNVSVIAFSCMQSLSGYGEDPSSTFAHSILPSTALMEKAMLDERWIKLYNGFFSQANYESVFEEGVIQTSKLHTTYETEDGNYHGLKAIQAINQDFYSFDGISLSDVVSRMQSLVTQSTPRSTSAWESAVTSLNYVLAAYGNSPELLVQLEIYREAFPDKSSATAVGRWYHSFAMNLSRINKLVLEGTKLNQRTVSTPIVRDWRGQDLLVSGVSGFYREDLTGEDIVYAADGKMLLSRYGLWDPEVTSADGSETISFTEFAAEYTLLENGFFWIDYEKLQQQASYFSKFWNSYFSVAKFNSTYGTDILNKFYRIKGVRCQRYDTTDDENPVYDALLVYNSFYEPTVSVDTDAANVPIAFQYKPGFPVSRINESTWGGYDGYEADDDDTIEGPDYRALYKLPWETAEPQLPFMAHRNVVIPNTTYMDNYRLIPIQFQNIMPSEGFYGDSPRDSDKIDITVIVEDYSTYACFYLLEDFFDFYAELEAYVELASEYCSYNNVHNSGFNDFFVEAMTLKYVDDPSSAPWIRGPAYYVQHTELLYEYYAGSSGAMRAAAVSMAKQIAPSTGTLDDLKNFFEKIKEIYTVYYNKYTVEMSWGGYSPSSFGSTGVPYAVSSISHEQEWTVTVDISDYGLPDFTGLEDFEAGDLEFLEEAAREAYTTAIEECYLLYSEIYQSLLTYCREWNANSGSSSSKEAAKGRIKRGLAELFFTSDSKWRQIGQKLVDVGEIDSVYLQADDDRGEGVAGRWTRWPSAIAAWIYDSSKGPATINVGTHMYTDAASRTYDGNAIIHTYGSPAFTQADFYETAEDQTDYVSLTFSEAGVVDISLRTDPTMVGMWPWGWVPSTAGGTGQFIRFTDWGRLSGMTWTDEAATGSDGSWYTFPAKNYNGIKGFSASGQQATHYHIADVRDFETIISKHYDLSGTGRDTWANAWEGGWGEGGGYPNDSISWSSSLIKDAWEALFCYTVDGGKCGDEYYEVDIVGTTGGDTEPGETDSWITP